MRESAESMKTRESDTPSGASPQAIRAHYDLGNEFFHLWLDESMTYSCALWNGEDDNLAAAQARKLDYHIHAAHATLKEAVLEVGCGWGGCLRKLVMEYGVKKAVGLTLSQAQAEWINAQRWPGVEARVENYVDHSPTNPYDAIICIAATAHFVRPEHTREERANVLRDFFRRCHEWLVPHGYFSLQSIVYGTGQYLPHSPLASVFPESDMPKLCELTVAFDRLFEPVEIVNHREHYCRTLSCWLSALESNRANAIAVVGSDTYERYRRYLRAGIKGHDSGVFLLLRYALRKLEVMPALGVALTKGG